jgi:hypothetical protein
METDSVGRGVRKLTVYEEELGNWQFMRMNVETNSVWGGVRKLTVYEEEWENDSVWGGVRKLTGDEGSEKS